MKLTGIVILVVAAMCGNATAGEVDAVRNYGVTTLEAPAAPTAPAAPQYVAWGHSRGSCCGGNNNFAASYAAYGTYQPGTYTAYYGAVPGYYRGNGAPWVYNTPNPYGYYPNGQVWGSSGPTYAGPFPVWNSPSGYYGYRYNGWGSYGWGGWGGTGPAGWGYQGGFFW